MLTADLNAAAGGDHKIACFGTVLIHASTGGKCEEMVKDLNRFVTIYAGTGRRGSGQSGSGYVGSGLSRARREGGLEVTNANKRGDKSRKSRKSKQQLRRLPAHVRAHLGEHVPVLASNVDARERTAHVNVTESRLGDGPGDD